MIVTPCIVIERANQYGATTQTTTNSTQQPQTTKAPPTPTLEWNFATGDLPHSPCVADVDGDGELEVLIGIGSDIYCLSGTGSSKWSYPTGDAIEGSPCVADVNGDGKLEVLVGSNDRNVYCLNGATGSKLWNYTTGAMFSTSPCVADVDGDTKPEVLVGSDKMYCLNGTTGAKEWSYEEFVVSSPYVADIDGDTNLEVLAGTGSKNVTCLSGTGAFKWNYTTGGYVRSPCAADINYDGKMEVLAGSDDWSVYCLNGTGQLMWRYITQAPVATYPCVADVDGDGKPEVLVPSSYFVYWLNGTGARERSFRTGDYIQTSLCVADIDGDMKLEVLVGAADKKVYCLGGSGGLEWNYATGDIVCTSTCVADVDGDGQLEVLVGSMDCVVCCLSVAGAPFYLSAFPWPSLCYGSDIRHTGVYIDTDHDNLTNNYEGIVGTSVSQADNDGDGSTDYQEFLASTNPFVESVKPAKITLAVGAATDSSLTLTWTAPGDDGSTGTAAGYVVKYSTSEEITETNWASATNYTQSWIPVAAGGAESHIVSNLASNTQYWFAVKAFDEVPNYGDVSNSPSGTTTVDTTAPAAITDLALTASDNASITMSWTPPGDNGNTGTATGYVVKYSTSGPVTDANWASAVNYTQSWTPLAAGSIETRVVIGLNADTTYWFAIKAYDEVPNYGGISNSPSRKTGVPVSQVVFPNEALILAIGAVAAVAVVALISMIIVVKKKR
jgi:outer membrane protein assembly factor BamB